MLSQITQEGAFDASVRQQINSNFAACQLITQGNIYWVRPYTGLDSNNGLQSQQGTIAGQGPLKTLAAALAKCTANQNDIVLFCAESNTASRTTDYQSAVLDWNKDLTHLIGVNSGSFIGQRSRIAPLSTAASFANLFKVSANACLIQNIEVFQGAGADTLGTAQTAVLVSGQRNHFVNCQFSGIGHATLDVADSNSLTVTGSENTFDDCYIGLDTIIRATSVTEVIFSGTPTRNVFRRCHFETYTSGSTFKMITVPTGADRFIKFIDCDFVAVQNISSAVAPTGLIGITTMNGQVIMRNPYLYGFAQYVTADNAYVQILGYNGLATGNLIGIAQGVNAA